MPLLEEAEHSLANEIRRPRQAVYTGEPMKTVQQPIPGIRTNEVMKVLTICGTRARARWWLSRFFGMNLRLPWNDGPRGVWYMGGLMELSTVLVLFYFRWKRRF